MLIRSYLQCLLRVEYVGKLFSFSIGQKNKEKIVFIV